MSGWSGFRVVMLGLGMVTLYGCGQSAQSTGSPVGVGSSGGGSMSKVFSIVIDSDADLPACGDANKKQLVYVNSTKTFKSCETSGWVVIDMGGYKIVSNKAIKPYDTDLCTMFPTIESCYFNGGQIVKYSDGSVLITSGYSYDMFVSASANGGSPEYDRLASSITVVVAPEMQVMWQRLDWSVSRGSVAFSALYLVYSRQSDSIKIVFDSNDSGELDATDEVVHTAVISDW